MKTHPDILGFALKDYYFNHVDGTLTIFSDIADEDEMQVSYFFRQFEDMTDLEKRALKECTGSVLDIGAGAGCHSLVLKERGHTVTPVDTSPGAVEVMKARGLPEALCQDFQTMTSGKYDTILLLMNGIGLTGTLDGLHSFLDAIPSFLNKGGQILLESTDIAYMFMEEDGTFRVDLNRNYYGEVNYSMGYKRKVGEVFPWLYVGDEILQDIAESRKFIFEWLEQSSTGSFLARLKLNV